MCHVLHPTLAAEQESISAGANGGARAAFPRFFFSFSFLFLPSRTHTRACRHTEGLLRKRFFWRHQEEDKKNLEKKEETEKSVEEEKEGGGENKGTIMCTALTNTHTHTRKGRGLVVYLEACLY